jgi:hypothetical protein
MLLIIFLKHILAFFIGITILGVILYYLIKTHNWFSKDNVPVNPEQSVITSSLIKPIF